MKLFLDTNIAMDAIQNRSPYASSAKKLLALSEISEFDAWCGASQFTDLYYLLRRSEKGYSNEDILGFLSRFKAQTQTCSLTETDIDQAMNSGWKDFEDACIYSMADRVGADYIITRNKKDFADSLIKVVDCDGFFDALEQQGITYDWGDLF